MTPKKIETTDSKITNFSILVTKEENMNIIDEFKINAFQNFEQYFKINPIDVYIIDSEIQTKLLCYAKKYKYRFIVNSLLFSSSITNDTKTIFITTNGLNDAKYIIITGKTFQGIGIIYTTEVEDWEKIKNKWIWTNVLLNILLALNILLLDLKLQICIIY